MKKEYTSPCTELHKMQFEGMIAISTSEGMTSRPGANPGDPDEFGGSLDAEEEDDFD